MSSGHGFRCGWHLTPKRHLFDAQAPLQPGDSIPGRTANLHSPISKQFFVFHGVDHAKGIPLRIGSSPCTIAVLGLVKPFKGPIELDIPFFKPISGDIPSYGAFVLCSPKSCNAPFQRPVVQGPRPGRAGPGSRKYPCRSWDPFRPGRNGY